MNREKDVGSGPSLNLYRWIRKHSFRVFLSLLALPTFWQRGNKNSGESSYSRLRRSSLRRLGCQGCQLQMPPAKL